MQTLTELTTLTTKQFVSDVDAQFVKSMSVAVAYKKAYPVAQASHLLKVIEA